VRRCTVSAVMRRALSLLRVYAFDLAIVAMAVGSIAEFVLIRDLTVHEHGPSGRLALVLPALLSLTLPLVARRRFPFGAPAAAITSAAVFSFFVPRLIPHLFFTFFAAMTIAFLLAYLNEWRHAVAGFVVAQAAVQVVNFNDPEGGVGDVLFVGLLLMFAWLGGLALNRRLAHARTAEERLVRLEREREERARKAVVEERARIARELHDVVGHHVSVMTIHAGAVRRLLREDQARERDALATVEQTGREALAEMRRMVGVLRRADESPALAPQPSLDHLQKLVEQTREAGLAVELRVEGTPLPLPAGVDLTAYRLVQEGLTNALKHADARQALVLVRYDGDGVELVIDDDGRGAANGTGAGGHGLVGMRERISVYGGELDAGGRREGGFRLRARIPLEPA
jgi:signal transduction histidine kinase